MNTEFVARVGHCAPMVRKRDLRGLGDSPLAESLRFLLQSRLRHQLRELSPVLIGDTIVKLFVEVIEEMRPTDPERDTPQQRQYVYLWDYLVRGNEWTAVSDDLGVARSTFYEIQKAALDALAVALWRLEEEAKMHANIAHNLGRPPYYSFIERRDDDGRSYIDDILIPELREGRAWIVAIEGQPGVGKSSLAYATADKCVNEPDRTRLPFNAVVWVSCRPAEYVLGKDVIRVHSVPTSVPQMMDVIGTTLGKRGVLQLAPEVKQEYIRELLQEPQYCCLFVLDNLDSQWLPKDFKKDIEAFIQSLPPPHKALVTMRQGEYWTGQRTIPLKTMSIDTLREFMHQEARDKVLPFADAELDLVFKKTQGNALALKQALSLTRTLGYSLEEALDFERYSRGMLEFMYSKAFDRLPVEAKKVLAVMPLFIVSASSEALGAASGITGPEKVKAIGLLYRAYMIDQQYDERSQEPRYALLPFTRGYLGELRGNPDAVIDGMTISDFLTQAYTNLADYYEALMNQYEPRVDSMLLFLKTDMYNLFGIMEWCLDNDRERLVRFLEHIGIPLGALRRLERRKFWGKTVVDICRELNWREAAGWFLVRDVAWTLVSMGTDESRREAQELLDAARKEAETERWERNLALILRNLGRLAIQDDKLDLAQQYLEESLALWEKVGDSYWQLTTQHALADVKAKRGPLSEARALYRKLEKEFVRIGYVDGQIEVMSDQAQIAVQEGGCDEARRLSDIALEWVEDISYPANVGGYALGCRSDIERMCGNSSLAIAMARRAQETYEALGMSYYVEKLQRKIDELELRPSEAAEG